MVKDEQLAQLAAPEIAALALTDNIIGMPGQLSPEAIAQLRNHYSDAEIVELTLGVGLFMGMSKVLIMLGLEPQQMDTTVLPTPGST